MIGICCERKVTVHHLTYPIMIWISIPRMKPATALSPDAMYHVMIVEIAINKTVRRI